MATHGAIEASNTQPKSNMRKTKKPAKKTGGPMRSPSAICSGADVGECTTGNSIDVEITMIEPEIPKDFILAMEDVKRGRVTPMFRRPKFKKTLGQVAYERSPEGGQQNFGAWDQAPEVVRCVHEQMAAAVEKEVLRRRRMWVLNVKA